MKLQRGDVFAEQPRLAATATDRLQFLNGPRVEQPDELRLLHVLAMVDIFDHDDTNEVRVTAVMVECELCEPLERFDWRQMIELEILFPGAHLAVCLLEHTAVEPLLVPEIIVIMRLEVFVFAAISSIRAPERPLAANSVIATARMFFRTPAGSCFQPLRPFAGFSVMDAPDPFSPEIAFPWTA